MVGDDSGGDEFVVLTEIMGQTFDNLFHEAKAILNFIQQFPSPQREQLLGYYMMNFGKVAKTGQISSELSPSEEQIKVQLEQILRDNPVMIALPGGGKPEEIAGYVLRFLGRFSQDGQYAMFGVMLSSPSPLFPYREFPEGVQMPKEEFEHYKQELQEESEYLLGLLNGPYHQKTEFTSVVLNFLKRFNEREQAFLLAVLIDDIREQTGKSILAMALMTGLFKPPRPES